MVSGGGRHGPGGTYRSDDIRGTDWPVAPRVAEEVYSVADAVVVGSLLMTLLKHADRVSSACLSMLVNAMAPIRAEAGGDVWRQTTFYPFALTSRLARGTVLDVRVQCKAHETKDHGRVPVIDVVATHDQVAQAVVETV
jgi:alpha-N-arabinofuranosidase